MTENNYLKFLKISRNSLCRNEDPTIALVTIMCTNIVTRNDRKVDFLVNWITQVEMSARDQLNSNTWHLAGTSIGTHENSI